MSGEQIADGSEVKIEAEASLDGLDTKAALAEISSDLFGQGSGEDQERGEAAKVGKQDAVVGSAPASQEKAADATGAVAETANSPAVVEIGAPNTWSKEALADWATIPPRAQQEILKREADIHKGIETYREKAELGTSYDKAIEPYRAALAAENINPVDLFQNFAGNHYLLSRGTPEQKLGIAANLITHYGIDVEALFERVISGAPQKAPEIVALEAKIAQLEQSNSQVLSIQQSAQIEALSREVGTFASDPKNSYFPEVAEDIERLLTSGAASTLQQAYDLAVWNNPVTRDKEISRMSAEKISQQNLATTNKVSTAQTRQAANINSSPKTIGATTTVGTMDETLEETYAAIKARG